MAVMTIGVVCEFGFPSSPTQVRSPFVTYGDHSPAFIAFAMFPLGVVLSRRFASLVAAFIVEST